MIARLRRLVVRPSGEALAIYAVAVAVYAVGLWWGAPAGVRGHALVWGTDEIGPVGAVNEVYGVLLARHPYFNPQYPLFHYLVQLVLVAPVYALFYVTGLLGTPDPNFPYGFTRPDVALPVLTIAARLPSLLMAAGVVVAAWKTGTVLRDVRLGRWAALTVGLLYPMAYYARTSNVDMGALFWLACGLLVFARCLRGETTRGRLLALAIFAALSAGSKDASYAAFLPLGLLAAWWHVRDARAAGASWGTALGGPAIALVSAAALYAVASGLVLRPSRFVLHFQYVTHGSGNPHFYNRYPWTADGHLAFARELGWQFVDTFGAPLLAVALAGSVQWLHRDRRLAVWLIPAVTVIAFVILPVRFALLRFLLPVGYVLAFPAADLLARAWHAGAGAARLTLRAATIAILAVAAARTADLTWQMLHDSRDLATAWLASTMRPGDTLGHVDGPDQRPRVPAGATLKFVKREALASGAERPEWFVSMPLEDYEHAHEDGLADDDFAALMDGRLGYRLAATIQTPPWFDRRPATFVNPPIRIFAREDVWRERLAAASATR
ncbi:MAG: hypothetical protein U0P30_11300 [Vicinamibacterales bacterium]